MVVIFCFSRCSVSASWDEIENDESFLSLLDQTEWHVDSLNLSENDGTTTDQQTEGIPMTVEELIQCNMNVN